MNDAVVAALDRLMAGLYALLLDPDPEPGYPGPLLEELHA